MQIQKDFRDLLELFNENNVKYIVVGGYALAYHGVPRYTGDIDLWTATSVENAQNILQALKQFGFGSTKLTIDDLTGDNQIVQLGYPPVRIDIITSVDGLDWERAFYNSIETSYGDVTIRLISLSDFIKNKKASGRHKDLADLEALGEKVE